ncbi:MAG: glycosyltransferase [Actinomycetota bacterium]
MTELSVILTAHNRADLIEETLASLAEQEWDGDWEILFVDNASTDATPELLERWADKMPVPATLHSATDGQSCAYARNAGAAISVARSIAFVDDDDVLDPGWVGAIAEALRDHDYVASRIDYTLLNEPAIAELHSFQTRRLGTFFGVPIVDGAGSGIRRTLWHDVGGADEELAFSEDADLGLRIARRGDVIPYFCADAVNHARLRTSTSTAWSRGTRRGFAEAELFARHGDAVGVRADRLPVAIARWLRLLPQLRWTTTETGRAHWSEAAGRRVGRLRGSRATRRWFP